MKFLLSLIFTVVCNNKWNAQAIDCPPNFDNLADDICTIIQEETSDFCSANDACHQMGLSRNLRVNLIGMNVTKIISWLKRSGSIYTSINKLLRPDQANRAGWRVGVPGQANFMTQGNEMDLWDDDQPEDKREVVTAVKDGKLHDVTMEGFYYSALCEWAGRGSSILVASGIERFNAEFPESMNDLFFRERQIVGCLEKRSAVTLIECAKICKLEYRCRSFYFNAKMSKCYMALYVDSLLSLGDKAQSESHWVRYARPNW
ncbi:hypothetical protein FGIG_01310 [Fasciola gigantica]|uniref:Apple domain-containing protein n=1 Tax=Fasciola gigantica TaxID=46835 RepID=A0A504YRT9_FASGI|nr:hypothetical protein FGIG_01310 [Fasciola gigantica]